MRSKACTRSLITAGVVGLLSVAVACGDAGGAGGSGKVSITVGCKPPQSNQAERAAWDADVARFEKENPDIDIQGKDAYPCINPDTFQAKLAGGTMEDVFYVYFTDVRGIVEKGQAADITSYLDEVPAIDDLRPDVMETFRHDGRTYGLPRNNYAMGLVYNRKLFERAGLDPDRPPETWAELRSAADAISDLGQGYVGFGEYSAGNSGGWHFAATLYARGGEMVTEDGSRAAFHSPEGEAVLRQLRTMRWTDRSMGSKQLHQWEDLMRMMGSGKLGMMLGAPDVVQQVNDDFEGSFEDYGVAAVPEAEASLNGGDGYMFHPEASPEQIRAGLKWLSFHELTPGQGQFDHERAEADGRTVGLPVPDLFGDSETGQRIRASREKHATVPVENFRPFVEGNTDVRHKPEPPKAQELYAILDTPMSAVLTRRDADIDQLLREAESKANQVLANAD